jgi:hypothetical protein
MKNFLNALKFIAILGLIYCISFFIASRLNLLQTAFFSAYSGVLILLGILGLTYNHLWSLNAWKKRPILSSVVILLILWISYTFSKISLQSFAIFKQLSSPEGKHWNGKVFQPDPVLGHVPVKCASGNLSLEYNQTLIHRVAIKWDENGFRIPEDSSCKRVFSRPLVMFLGCSFTEGADCPAERTFSSIVGDSIHGTSINAGVSSYGFSQMLLLARKLVPEYKPDYLVVQNSPWLSQRAISRYAPTFGLSIPSPYFAKVNDSIRIEPPAFPTSCFSLTWKYDRNKNKLSNFIDFYFRQGFAICAKDWLNIFLANFRTPGPVKDPKLVEKVFFDEIQQLSKENHDRLIVLDLGDIKTTSESHDIIKNSNVRFAEADSLLWKTANFSEKTFQHLYYYWGRKGNDSTIIDEHPTRIAHAIIAQSILDKIKN